MKRAVRILLVTVGVVMTWVMLLTGCSSQSENYEKKHLDLSTEEVESLAIDVRDRKIEILPSEDGQIQLDYYENEKEFYNILIDETKGLTMTCADNKQWGDYIGSKAAQENRTIYLRVPEAVLKDLNIKTTNEDVVLPELICSGSVSVITNQGNIELENLNVGTAVSLEAKNGNISGTIVGNYDTFSILSEAKKGKNNLPPSKEKGMKSLTAYTNNGDINLEFVD